MLSTCTATFDIPGVLRLAITLQSYNTSNKLYFFLLPKHFRCALHQHSVQSRSEDCPVANWLREQSFHFFQNLNRNGQCFLEGPWVIGRENGKCKFSRGNLPKGMSLSRQITPSSRVDSKTRHPVSSNKLLC